MDQPVNLSERLFFLLRTTLKAHILRLQIGTFN